MGGNLVSWSAMKQPTVTTSSCESEYRVMDNTNVELISVTHLLLDIHDLPPELPNILCDNLNANF